ncbi:MAG: diguanylate cyclase [Actinomycetota bacterium]|nr:diguanylate cyclase [Actinomycetota bacterium]
MSARQHRRELVLGGVATALLALVIVAVALVPPADGLGTLGFALVPVVLAALGSLRTGIATIGVASLALIGVVCATPQADALVGAGDGVGFVVAGLAVALATSGRIASPGRDDRWFEISNELLVEASLDGYFTRLAPRWEEVLGWSRAELMARPFREFIHPDDLAATNVHADALDVAPGDVFNFENRYRHKDGTYRWLLWSARSDRHRKYAVARDITERKALEQERVELLARLEEMASTDALTKLPNRRAWDRELAVAVSSAHIENRALALAMLDLDDFKAYNDAHGHGAGDALLAEAAAAWRQVLRPGDVLARYGGEEFAVLLPDCGVEEAAELLEQVRRVTPSPETCSVGIAALVGGESAEELSARADAALYEAKHSGRDRIVVARGPKAPPHRSLAARLRRAESVRGSIAH